MLGSRYVNKQKEYSCLLPEDTRPVTQARKIDIPMAEASRRALLPYRSTVNEHIIPPRRIQA
jgi:hypothetical protein